MPERPLQLKSTFIINRGNITARLSWLAPASDSPITGYRVQWGEVLLDFATGGAPADGDSSPVLDGNTAYFKVLSKVPQRESTLRVALLQFQSGFFFSRTRPRTASAT